MKKIFNLFLAVTTMAAVTSISSCTKTCDAGYEGTKCDTKITAKFLGNWKGQDICTTNTYTNITITNEAQSDILKITIKNLGGLGSTEVVTGTLVSGSSNQISFTDAALSGNRTVTGTMTVSGTTLTDSYVVHPAVGADDNCAGTYTKL
jgi:hypothetical protein